VNFTFIYMISTLQEAAEGHIICSHALLNSKYILKMFQVNTVNSNEIHTKYHVIFCMVS
jgi:hypothetical protein